MHLYTFRAFNVTGKGQTMMVIKLNYHIKPINIGYSPGTRFCLKAGRGATILWSGLWYVLSDSTVCFGFGLYIPPLAN